MDVRKEREHPWQSRTPRLFTSLLSTQTRNKKMATNTKYVVYSKSRRSYVYKSTNGEWLPDGHAWLGGDFFHCSKASRKNLLSLKGVAEKWAKFNNKSARYAGTVEDFEVREVQVEETISIRFKR